MVDSNVLKSIALKKKLLKFKSNKEKFINNDILKLKPLLLLNISFCFFVTNHTHAWKQKNIAFIFIFVLAKHLLSHMTKGK